MIAPVRRLGHYAYRWRGRIALAALLVAAAAAIGGASVFDTVKPYGFQDPDSESARATEALEDAGGERPLPDVVLIVEPRGGGPAKVDAAAAEAEQRLAEVPDVTRTATEGLSEDGRAALVVGYVDADIEDIADVGQTVEESFGGLRYVTSGGAAVTAHQLNETTEEDLRRIELYAAPLLFLLSLLVFRGLVAAALPIAVGLLSIVTTLLLLRLLTNVMEIDVFVVNIVIGLGLGLAIDYSLFVVSRFREELAAGEATGGALRRTIGSTGRMILFSGLTVGIALASLTVFPQRFLYSIGVGGALVALTSVLVSLTVLPAMLALLGPRVNALAPRRLQSPPSERRWYSLGKFVLRHPIPIATIVMAAMVLVSVPFLRVELTRADPSALPADASAHQVDAILDERFAGDPSSVIDVVLTERGSKAQLRRARSELERTEGVETVLAPERIGDDVRRVDALLGVDPFTDEALDAVEVARDLDWGAPSLVNGPPAELTDQRQSLADHLPAAVAIIVALDRAAAVRDDAVRGAPVPGPADERAHRRRRLRCAGADLPGRAAGGLPRLHRSGCAGHIDPDPAVRRRLRPLHRLRGVPAAADRGAALSSRQRARGDRPRPGSQRAADHLRGAAVRGGDGSVRLLGAGLHQGDRDRDRPGGAGGRGDRADVPFPRPARGAGGAGLVGACLAGRRNQARRGRAACARARARASQRMTGAPSRSMARKRACTTSSANWVPALSNSSSRAASGSMPGR